MTRPAPSHQARAGLFVLVALLLLAAFIAGWVASGVHLRAQAPLVILPDGRAVAPTVAVEGIVDGALLLRTAGGVRILAGNKAVQADANGLVRVEDKALLTNKVNIQVPAGMRFVASKRGQKYYPVNASAAQGIVPENRVYFPDEDSARKAGFSAE